MRRPQPLIYQRPYWYWCRAQFWNTGRRRQEQAFSGPWPSEAEAQTWAIQKYAAMPGSDFQIVKSKSRDRNTAKNETRQTMVDEGEGDIGEVLNVRFRNQNKDS